MYIQTTKIPHSRGDSLWRDVVEHIVIQPFDHLHHLLGVGRTGVNNFVDHFTVTVAVRCRYVDEGLMRERTL